MGKMHSIGKMPPSAVDLENAVLGAILIEKGTIDEVIAILKPEDFYKEAHQVMYRTILDLYAKSSPIDILTVTAELRRTGKLELVGGPFYVADLTTNINSAANVEYHARIIAEMSLGRKLIMLSSNILKKAYDNGDHLELLENVSKEIFSMEAAFFTKEVKSIKDLSLQLIQEAEIASKAEGGIVGTPSGLLTVDNALKGLMKPDLIIIAGRPGMGKSSVIHTMSRNISVGTGEPTAIFSLEMSALQVTNSLHSIQCDIEYDKIRTGNLTEEEWAIYHQRLGPLVSSNIFIDDTPGISIIELRSKARKLVKNDGVKVIFVDFIQNISGMNGQKNNQNREQEIGFISRQLKEMAKELNVPVIALSSLSRACETRGGDKRPQMSDLRESGSIESDADIVILLYRPSYYGFTEDKEGYPIPHGLTELIIAKFRNGKTQTINLNFKGAFKKFTDLTTEFSYNPANEFIDPF